MLEVDSSGLGETCGFPQSSKFQATAPLRLDWDPNFVLLAARLLGEQREKLTADRPPQANQVTGYAVGNLDYSLLLLLGHVLGVFLILIVRTQVAPSVGACLGAEQATALVK